MEKHADDLWRRLIDQGQARQEAAHSASRQMLLFPRQKPSFLNHPHSHGHPNSLLSVESFKVKAARLIWLECGGLGVRTSGCRLQGQRLEVGLRRVWG